jgi:hypothetical protein
MKTYDRAQVLQVAAQLASGMIARGDTQDIFGNAVRRAKDLIDEVELQCPPPRKPEATPMPGNGRAVG